MVRLHKCVAVGVFLFGGSELLLSQNYDIFSQQLDGSASASFNSGCNNGCSNVVFGQQRFIPLISGTLTSISVFTSGFTTQSRNGLTNVCALQLFDASETLVASADTPNPGDGNSGPYAYRGSGCAGNLTFTFLASLPVLQVGSTYSWSFVFLTQNYTTLTFQGSLNNNVGGLFSDPPLLNAEFTAEGIEAGTGNITVSTNTASATFAITGPTSLSGSGTSYTFNGVPTGIYTITFGSVPGYVSPLPQIITLFMGTTVPVVGTYVPATVFPNQPLIDQVTVSTSGAHAQSDVGTGWDGSIASGTARIGFPNGSSPGMNLNLVICHTTGTTGPSNCNPQIAGATIDGAATTTIIQDTADHDYTFTFAQPISLNSNYHYGFAYCEIPTSANPTNGCDLNNGVAFDAFRVYFTAQACPWPAVNGCFEILWNTGIGAGLVFPVAANTVCAGVPCTPMNASISAVVDHHQKFSGGLPVAYSKDHVVVDFRGETGRCNLKNSNQQFWSPIQESRGDGVSGGAWGYMQGTGGFFTVNGNYTGGQVPGGTGSDEAMCGSTTIVNQADSRLFLFYDGHAGYDYPFSFGTAVYPAISGCVTYAVPAAGNSTQSKYHTLAIIPMNTEPPNGQCPQNVMSQTGYVVFYLHLSTYVSPTDGKTIMQCPSKPRGTSATCANPVVCSTCPTDGTWVSATASQPIAYVGNFAPTKAYPNGAWGGVGNHLHFEVGYLPNPWAAGVSPVPLDPYGWYPVTPGMVDPYPGVVNTWLWQLPPAY